MNILTSTLQGPNVELWNLRLSFAPEHSSTRDLLMLCCMQRGNKGNAAVVKCHNHSAVCRGKAGQMTGHVSRTRNL